MPQIGTCVLLLFVEKIQNGGLCNIDDNLVVLLRVSRHDFNITLTEKPLQLSSIRGLILVEETESVDSTLKRLWKGKLASLKVWPDVLLKNLDVKFKT